MLFERWASVADAGKTLKQHRLSDSWLMGYVYYIVFILSQQ